MRKLLLLAGVLMLAPVSGASAQNFQLPNLGNVIQDTLNPNRDDGRRAYEERRAEQDRREAYRDRRDDERRAYDDRARDRAYDERRTYEDRARRDDRVGSPSWSRGRDDANRGRGRGNGRGNGSRHARGQGK